MVVAKQTRYACQNEDRFSSKDNCEIREDTKDICACARANIVCKQLSTQAKNNVYWH